MPFHRTLRLMLGLAATAAAAAALPGAAEAARPANNAILIDEFRTQGVNGAQDEYVELYNNTDNAIVLNPDLPATEQWFVSYYSPTKDEDQNGTPGPGGYIDIDFPIGTTLPARSRMLIANTWDGTGTSFAGYSLFGYATPDRPYDSRNFDTFDSNGDFAGAYTAGDNPRDGGWYVYWWNGTGTAVSDFELTDEVGFTGNTYNIGRSPLLAPMASLDTSGQYAWVRKIQAGMPVNTGQNAPDFQLVGNEHRPYGGVPSVQGAPGPQNVTSGAHRNDQTQTLLFDGTKDVNAPPNRVFTWNANAGKGQLIVRRKIQNISGKAITRLRFRMQTLSTYGTTTSPSEALLVLGSSTASGSGVNGTYPAVLDPFVHAPTGRGGVNSSATLIDPATGNPLQIPAGATRNVEFRFEVERGGSYKFGYRTEVQTAP